MASGHTISWQIEAEKVEAVTDFIFLGFNICCSHKIKRYLLLGRKTMTNLDSILKSKDITLVHIVKTIIFPVVMHEWSCTIKNAEWRRIDAF